MSDKECKAYYELRKLALRTKRSIKELKEDCDLANPVDMDMLKTTKAMFYEEAIEIFKKYK